MNFTAEDAERRRGIGKNEQKGKCSLKADLIRLKEAAVLLLSWLPVLLLQWLVPCKAICSQSILTVPNLSALIRAERILAGSSWFDRHGYDHVACTQLASILGALDVEMLSTSCSRR